MTVRTEIPPMDQGRARKEREKEQRDHKAGDPFETIDTGDRGTKPGEVTAKPNGEDKPEPWPDPLALPHGMPDVLPFSLDMLPFALRPWIEDVSERQQTPPDFVAIGAMVALGALIGRQLAIKPKRQDDWTVVPNLWGAVIGSPGVLKSPALHDALSHLRAMEVEAKNRHEEDMTLWEARNEVAAEQKRARGETIKKRLKENIDADEIARDLAAKRTEIPKPPRRRFLTNDPSVEKMGELLRETPNGLLLYRDELMGWLRSLEADAGEFARAFYLEAWNGTGRFTSDRIGRGTIDIEAACVSVLGGIQPGPLLAFLANRAWDGAGADGLLQRFQLAVWPDIPRRWCNVDRHPNTVARNQAREIFKRCRHLSQEIPNPDGGMPDVRFDSEAQDAFDVWRVGLEERLRGGDLHPAFEAHLAKYRSLTPSLALICHVADCHEVGPVGVVAFRRAEAWVEYLESHAVRIYDALLRPDQAAARTLGDRIKDLPSPFSLRDVYRPCWSGLTTKEFAQEAVDTLCDLGWLRAEHKKPSKAGGRPTVAYHVNPAVRVET